MWMDPEDARSDFILAAATTLFGSIGVSLLAALPLYPDAGTLLAGALIIVWQFALTGLVPLLLARYRDQRLEAFGLEHGRDGLRLGLLLVLPVLAVGILRTWTIVTLPEALLGRLGAAMGGSPVIGAGAGMADVVLEVGVLLAAFVGSLLLVTFLTVRARDAWGRTSLTQVEALRTFGMGAAAAALVLGMLNAIGPVTGVVPVLLNVGALVALVLIVDRVVEARAETTRATILAPAIVAALLQVIASGGVFSRGLLLGLYAGAVAGGVTVVVATLVETRRYAWAAVPLLAATALYPTCLSPVTMAGCG